MSYYVAYPAHLLDELLALLPSDERPVYAERFENVAGDLVWLRDDAQNAVEAALADCEDPGVSALHEDSDARRTLVEQLMDVDNAALTALVQDGLTTIAADLIHVMLVERSRKTEQARPEEFAVCPERRTLFRHSP